MLRLSNCKFGEHHQSPHHYDYYWEANNRHPIADSKSGDYGDDRYDPANPKSVLNGRNCLNCFFQKSGWFSWGVIVHQCFPLEQKSLSCRQVRLRNLCNLALTTCAYLTL